MSDIKVIYMGTPDFSVKPLDEINKNYNVIAVVTQPDKQVGRKQEVVYSKVKEYAINNNIKVIQPVKIKDDYNEILSLNPDIIITCAYGQIIPKEILNYPKYGCINIHASLLPLLRGGAPIHKAIINGYDKTGITIMYMDEKMDSGDIIYQEEINIDINDTAGSLFDKLSILGSKTIIKVLPNIISGNINPIKQDETKVTYAFNVTKEEEKISFNEPSLNVYNKIRGLNPWPVGYAILENKKIKIYESKIGNSNKSGIPGEIINLYNDGIGIKTIDGEIIITKLQVEGKKMISVKDYLNGIQNKESLIGKSFE